MSKVVYAGSFDPITNGHLWMIRQGAEIFEQLVVAIGVNPEKRCTFSLEERLSLVRSAVKDIPRCTVEVFENRYLVEYARSIGASHILRGIRNESDYTYERVMRNINGDLADGITTLFLMPPRDIAEVSSSMVKGLVGPAGWKQLVCNYVPVDVFSALLKWHEAGHG